MRTYCFLHSGSKSFYKLLPQYSGVNQFFQPTESADSLFIRFNIDYHDIHFETIKTLPAAGKSNILRNYAFDDFQSINFKGQTALFRIMEKDINGQSFYTNVKKVKIPDGKSRFILLYNLVGNDVLLNYESAKRNEVTMRVSDHLVRGILTQKIAVIPVNNQIALPPANLAEEIYKVEMKSKKDYG
ncbi:MAG: hypothetical protein ABIR03_04775 [Ginsengibacter sp.]